MDMHNWEKVYNRPTLVATEDEGTVPRQCKALTKAAAENFLRFLYKVKICIKWKKLLQEQKILPWSGRTYFRE
jgi:hypothetical protein